MTTPLSSQQRTHAPIKIALIARSAPSQVWLYTAPLFAVSATLITALIIFMLLGVDSVRALYEMIIVPLIEVNRWPDLLVKASPLMMIALGLSLSFRANIWNIGAEGQYIVGAIVGSGVALTLSEYDSVVVLPAVLLAGTLGGMIYASVPAFLRSRYGVSEILTSLMLSYCAVQVLYLLVNGPWKDPQGFNFPQTRLFGDAATLTPLMEGTVLHAGMIAAFLVAILAAILVSKTVFGFAITVVGLAPNAARYAGFRADTITWICLLLSGGLAGLAGIIEVCANFQQLTPQFPAGYGFTAIIVAFLGRLNPLGIVLAALVLAVTYVGGELAQTSVGLPQAAGGVFQALLLFYLLAFDVLVRYRIAVAWPRPVSHHAQQKQVTL